MRLKSTNPESSKKAWKVRTNYLNDHHNKEIFGPIRKHTTNRKGTRWTEGEERDAINKEIQLRRENPNVTEKEINQRLYDEFDHIRSIGSYESRRKTSKWKTMVLQQLDNKDTHIVNDQQQEKNYKNRSSTPLEDEYKSEEFWLIRQRQIATKKQTEFLQKTRSQMKPYHHAIAKATDEISVYSPHSGGFSVTTLAELSDVVKFEERSSNILEHGAKGIEIYLGCYRYQTLDPG